MTAPPAPSRVVGPATVLIVIGCCCVVAGGLVAAVTGPLDLVHGSWLAAYLVLVCGVAQVAMGAARTWHLDHHQRARSWPWVQVGAWNLGSVAVIGGTLAGEPPVVDLGSVLLVVAAAIALGAAGPGSDASIRPTSAGALPLVRGVYRLVLVVLLVSIPVGMVLSHLRHG